MFVAEHTNGENILGKCQAYSSYSLGMEAFRIWRLGYQTSFFLFYVHIEDPYDIVYS